VGKTIEDLKKFAMEVALANPSLINFQLWETKDGDLVVEVNERVGKREKSATVADPKTDEVGGPAEPEALAEDNAEPEAALL
jgi:hypothetical protein